jgi:outer membrane biosynthesis protein TonB
MKHFSLCFSVALHVAVILPFVISKQADSAVFQSQIIGVELALGESIDDEVTKSTVAQEAIMAVEEVIEEKPVEEVKVVDETAEVIEQEKKKEEVKPAVQQEALNDNFEKKLAGVDFGVRGGGMTNASYGANVKKMIEKNKKRPPGGLKGNVKIGFLIGSKGKVESTWVVNSTNDKLNLTAEAIINSITTLPPPEGKFTGVIEIKFD